MESTDYIPGACNIGPQERILRRSIGFVCAFFFIALLLAFHFTYARYSTRLLLLIPAFIGSLGLIQDAMRFCVNFGFQGVFNLTRPVGKTQTVEQAEFRRLDREKAVEIICYSIVTSLTATYIALLYK